MAEELLEMINLEEYVSSVTAFPSTEYLNKTDIASLKKMIAGKMWIDSRKFVSRQSTIVINGLYALFGTTLGKSACGVRAEACDVFLDPDSKDLRSVLRDSIGKTNKSYSTWIRRLSSDDFPCDEFGLFLLSYVFKRHVIVVLANSLWCTFKPGRMSTFEKLCKGDHVLLWLGDDRYAEVKPLQTKRGYNNFVEWQQVAESIDHLHQKNTSGKRQRHLAKSTASISTPTKRKIQSPPPQNRISSKRESKVHIDYKQLHKEGVFEIKQRTSEKYLPRSSGPSQSRLEAQKYIVRNKASPQTSHNNLPPEPAATTAYVPRQNIAVSVPSIKREIAAYHSMSRNVKQEPGIFMTRRKNPKDNDRDWRYVHVSGRCCNQGGQYDCNSQLENELENEEILPDLPIVPDPALQTMHTTMTPPALPPLPENSNGGNNAITLISPPAIVCQLNPPTENSVTRNVSHNLNNLLCTLNFDGVPQPNNPSPNSSRSTQAVSTTSHPLIKDANVIVISSEDSSPNTTRKVVTSASEQPTYVEASVSNTPDYVLPTDPAKDNSVPRKVVTPKKPMLCEMNQPDMDNLGTELGQEKMLHNTSVDNKTTTTEDATSQQGSTPRSVIMNPDSQELETANVLLELSKTPNDLDSRYDNSELLPVDSAPLEDFSRAMKELDTDNSTVTLPLNSDKDTNNNVDVKRDSDDSDDTVDYTNDQPSTVSSEAPQTAKGKLSYKHFGIRKSPVTAPIRNIQCYYCDTICHSKREINNHHKSEHTTVKCPTCPKIFPTPDALFCHQYIHKETHRFKCALCEKTCAFKSDLDMHMLKHVEDKRWYCSFDGCTRDFKRKSDLTAHEVVHKGEDFICEFPNCKYTNKDPRLVKRHQRVHTRETKVRCPECSEKFVFYQQMKRHKSTVHS